jgi:ribosomal-protein-alanine N-acetyltransferase
MLSLFPESIQTERLHLQRLRYEDADEIFFAYASKAEATQFVSWPTHQSIRDTRNYVKYAVAAWQTGIDYTFTIRENSTHRLVGSIGLLVNEGKIQFGYILSPTVWGRGYATEACRAALAIARELPGVYRIGTFVDVANVASARVLEKCGLVAEARLPRWFRFINQQNAPRDCILFRLP